MRRVLSVGVTYTGDTMDGVGPGVRVQQRHLS